MERIDMSKRVVLGRQVPEGTYLGKLRGMLVYMEGSLGDEAVWIQVYVNQRLAGGKYQTVAELSLSTDYCSGAYHVDLMRVNYRFQGHGIAPLVYRFLLRKLGIVIQAGVVQSAGGRKLWAQLAKMKGITIFASGKRGQVATIIDDIDKDDDELHHEDIKLYDGPRTVYTFAVAA